MSSNTATAAKKSALSANDRIAFAGLLILIVVSNVWFFSQALTYVH
jgi:hypothetical protein